MTDTPPPRRALATFLRRATTRDQGSGEAVPPAGTPGPAAPLDTPSIDGTGDSTQEPAPTAPTASADIATSAVAPDAEFEEASPSNTPSVPAHAAVPDAAPEPVAAATVIPPEATPAAEDRDPLGAQRDDTDTQAPEEDTASKAAAWQAATLPVAAASAPTFARPRVRPAGPRTSLWQWSALIVLALVLALQILLADRARLAGDAQWRPLLTSLCTVLRCDLPAWHEPAAFTMLDRDVRPASDQAGALRIQASFRNDARWSQDWPALQLSLSDADGRVIGTRVFSPTEYLGHPPGTGEQLASGQSARIDFRVREPAAGTAAFTFEFH